MDAERDPRDAPKLVDAALWNRRVWGAFKVDLLNPDNKLPYPGDIVSVDPNAKAMLNGLVPLPNNGPIGYISAPSLPNDWRQENVRIRGRFRRADG